MNDKVKMLEAKRARLVVELGQVDLALGRARTGYLLSEPAVELVEACPKKVLGQYNCQRPTGHAGPCNMMEDK